MKRLKLKATSKKTDFEVFIKLSLNELNVLKGGTTETPPDECENESNSDF
ncbi:MAG: hypothetical protein PF517_10340 [Salinivirgaceae bacterium]|jgi:hypothetical protein|nr:hypothetical protein [Salinivirgaceae bacterium]